ncbi:matrin-3-like isoform X2 [Anguilla anguilla]|uniref:matrin-3-like isoform X2 n=1 Tax=Anguilla anguilla TaxID=7936 RepID=UPI0015AB7C71|nr:matrin-3-like isoform X2 [Anguilla anguilla]
MYQKNPSDGAHKGFAVGRGLLAAAETLNFSMNDQRPLYGTSSRPSYGMSSGLGSGVSKNRDSHLPPRGSGHVTNTMKLFDSLGLSPTDIDALAQIPEENIGIETLPQLIMQLKNRKMEANRRMSGSSRDLPPISPEHSYRSSRDDWEDMPAGRMGSSGGQVSARGQQMDYGYGSMQEGPSRGYKRIDYGENSSGGMSRDRPYSELSRDRYGGLGMGPSPASDSGFLQKRMGSPSQGKVQDFLGVMPHMFPHVCSLCDFDVHSTMEWTQHSNGVRHMENRRLLLQMYPDWDPHMAASRTSGALLLDSTNRSAGILGPAPMGLPRGGMSSNWGAGMSNQKQPFSVTPKVRSRVVVAKYQRKPLTLNSLLVLAQPFGTVCQHLVLNNKAFLEMETHEEALAMANFYQRKPAVMHGKEITIYLSQELITIEKGNRDGKGRQSQVVFFSNLPREREKKSELLTVARRFGNVEKYLFLNDEAFVQLGTPEDAEMMVKYYTLHPLTIKGRDIRLNICEKYKTLIVNPSRQIPGKEREDTNRKSSTTSRKGSPKKQRSESTGERSSKSKPESATKEEDPAAGDSAVLEECSGEEISGVVEADEGDYDEAAETQEAEQAEIQDEAMIEPEESSTQQEEPVPDLDETQDTVEETCEVPPTAGSKEAIAEGPPSQAKTAQAEGEIPAEEVGTQENVPSTEPTESTEIPNEEPEQDQNMPMEQDFPENMEDFVTVDEVAEEEDADRLELQSKSGDSYSGNTKNDGGRKVVNVVGFRRGHSFLQEILNLAKPFGKVVRHLVLDARPEAFLELSSEEEARSMVAFYNANITPEVCGRPVKIHHSQAYSTIQSGRVLYIGQIPPFKGSDGSFLKIAEPFGKVRRYFLNRSRNECFIEMESSEGTERMANAYRENPPKFEGKQLTVYVSRKYKQLKYGLRPPSPEPEEERPPKREHSGAEEDSTAKNKVEKEEEPPTKKVCIREEKTTPAEPSSSINEEEKAASEEPNSNGEQQQEEEEKGTSETPCEQEELVVKTENENVTISQPSDSVDTQKKDTEGDCGNEAAGAPPCGGASEKSCGSEGTPSTKPQAEKKPAPTSLPLGPYQPNNPVGVEYVKMGYYCKVCFLFYSKEETAKKVHCSSLSHYHKLKKHLEKEKEKAKEKVKPQ